MSQPHAKVAVIGGSGLYEIEGMTDLQEVDLNTPFGKPSDRITVGRLGGTGIAFLPRHGRGHRIPPTDVPYRANIYALKWLGVEFVIGINSVGSFREEIKPGHLLIPDQVIDRTTQRVNTFFRESVVVHIPFAQPFCQVLGQVLFKCAGEAGATVHRSGTYVAMEGPSFSTKAESRLYRAWGAHVIGMTALPEARLAREAEMCYAVIACVTDYDSWQDASEPLTIELILDVMRKNIDIAKKIIRLAVGRVPPKRDCECACALKNAIVTPAHLIPPEEKQKLGLLMNKYIKEN